jgi:hypothetical protein
VADSKRRIWEEKVQDIDSADKLWKVAKKLSGKSAPPGDKVLVYKGKERISYGEKASAFVQEYAQTSTRKITKAD